MTSHGSDQRCADGQHQNDRVAERERVRVLLTSTDAPSQVDRRGGIEQASPTAYRFSEVPQL
jgi:hypothetical protein